MYPHQRRRACPGSRGTWIVTARRAPFPPFAPVLPSEPKPVARHPRRGDREGDEPAHESDKRQDAESNARDLESCRRMLDFGIESLERSEDNDESPKHHTSYLRRALRGHISKLPHLGIRIR
jgi:hypothetical protein